MYPCAPAEANHLPKDGLAGGGAIESILEAQLPHRAERIQ